MRSTLCCFANSSIRTDAIPFLTILELAEILCPLENFSSSACHFSTCFFCFSNSCLFVLVLKNPKVGFSSRHVMIMISAPIADAKDTAFLNALLLPDVPLYGTKIRSKFFVKFVLGVQRRILIITYFYFFNLEKCL